MYPIRPGLHPNTPTQRRVHDVLQPDSMGPLVAAGLPGFLSDDRKAQLLQLLWSNAQNLALQAAEVPMGAVERMAFDAKQFQELYAANPAGFHALVHYVQVALGVRARFCSWQHTDTILYRRINILYWSNSFMEMLSLNCRRISLRVLQLQMASSPGVAL